MYREYFGLQLKPFSITPDPKFLYMSPGHKEALAHLLYGLKEASGFVVITGEVGTGKTTILNAFILKLPPRMPKVVVKNPHLKPENLYFLLGEAIGIPEEKRSRDYIRDYEERLKEMGGAVLIVDESQGLSVEMLEEIRLLSNMETVNEKLVQIMLLGQQELNEKLKSPHLRQLKQRIGIKYHIPPLDATETKDYIDHRLRVSGYVPREKPLFTQSALADIYRFSKGYPRLINILCDNVLLSAYTDNVKQISASMVRKAASDLESTYQVKKHLTQTPRLWSLGSGWFMTGLKAMAVVLLLGAAAWFLVPALFDEQASTTSGGILMKQGAQPNGAEGGSETGTQASGHETEVIKKIFKQDIQTENGKVQSDPVIPPPSVQPGKAGTKVVTVRSGDTVAKLAADHYGMVDDGILLVVRKANPGIPNIDIVQVGQKVNLPPLDRMGQAALQVLYSVSVSSYHSIQEAKAVFTDLLAKGYQTTIYPYLGDNDKTWYRITIGTFTSRQDAVDYTRKLRNSGFPYAKPVKISMED
jgi:type II secretory pathway predicted ATPase ExeA/phage tail protein X